MWCQVRAQPKPAYINGSSILYQPCSRLEVGTIPLQLILELLNAKTEVNQGSARQVIPAFSGRSTGELKYESTKNRSEKCETLQKSLQDSPPSSFCAAVEYFGFSIKGSSQIRVKAHKSVHFTSIESHERCTWNGLIHWKLNTLPELSSDLGWIHELSCDWSKVKTELIAALKEPDHDKISK